MKYLSYKNINYGLTALTGCAAVLINGQTIHKVLKLPIKKSYSELNGEKYSNLLKENEVFC